MNKQAIKTEHKIFYEHSRGAPNQKINITGFQE